MRAARPATANATWAQVLSLRLERQHLVRRTTADCVTEVAAHLVGIHAQVMSAAELQLAARVNGLRPAVVQDLLWKDRQLVKVWAFRQTLHLLTPDDLAEFVVAARSLERWHTPAWLRYFVLTEGEIERLIDAIGEVLSERPMTRAAVAAAVAERLRKPALLEAMATGWGTFLAPAAQRGKLVFGPSEGRNVAFVSPSAWLRRPIDWIDDRAVADAALGRLIRRYLAVFPGATKEMVARWWGGGRMSAVNRALATIRDELEEVEVEGARGLVTRGDGEALAAVTPFRGVRLLPGFDPFTNELPRRVDSVLPDARHDLVHRTAGWVTPIVIVDGAVAGTWELDGGKSGSAVAVVPFSALRRGAAKELEAEVGRLSEFLGRPLSVSIGAAVG